MIEGAGGSAATVFEDDRTWVLLRLLMFGVLHRYMISISNVVISTLRRRECGD